MGIPLKPDKVVTGREVVEAIDDELAARIIEASAGILAFTGRGARNTRLSVSSEIAARYFSLAIGPGGDVYITGFDLHEIVSRTPIELTIPAYIDERPVTRLIDIRFDTVEVRAAERVRAKPMRAPLALLVLPETLTHMGRGVLSGLLPFVTRIPASLESIDLAGLAGQAAYLNAPFAAPDDPAPAKKRLKNNNFEDPAQRFGISRPTFGGSGPGLVVERSEDAASPGLRFEVDPESTRFCAVDGSLYTRDLSELLFLAMPYPRTAYLPEGLKYIGSDAYVYGRGAPDAIMVPTTLARAEFTPSNSTLWVIGGNDAFEEFARTQGWMAASPGFVEGDEFDYDPLPDGSVRIIRCKGRQASVSIPARIDGLAVTQVGSNAFPRLAMSIEVAEGVTHILGYATTPALKSISLPRTLQEIGPAAFVASELERPVVVPANCTRIGLSSFERGIMTFAAVGASILLDPPFTKFCFAEGTPPFDFARYDRDIIGFSGANLKLRAMLVRLASPYAMGDDVRAEFQAYAASRLSEVLDALTRSGDLNTLRLLLEADVFDERGCDEAIERFTAAGQTACTIELMDWRHQAFGHTQTRGTSRFAL